MKYVPRANVGPRKDLEAGSDGGQIHNREEIMSLI